MNTPPYPLEPKTVYRIIDRQDGSHRGAYSRARHDEMDFNSPEAARSSNCHGVFENRVQFKIAKYVVTYTLVQDDCDAGK